MVDKPAKGIQLQRRRVVRVDKLRPQLPLGELTINCEVGDPCRKALVELLRGGGDGR